ncbi:MAG: glycerol-3-phosphate dehydrogenase/oxidase [Chitinophagaceae bacterium]
MTRSEQLRKLKSGKEWDILIIGGGATGLGAALDAASRGYAVALVEKADFAKGTSSKSTKLVHGGVRYLAQGNVKLVKEALKERSILLQNAPHVSSIQPFIVPSFKWWERYFYGTGLTIYDLLSGNRGIGRTKMMSKNEVVAEMPYLRKKGLSGGIKYLDGQFDDARLAINLAQTAVEYGACVVNYAMVSQLIQENKRIVGAEITDCLTGEAFHVNARVIINATGVHVDEIIQLEHKGNKPLISPSQGIHIVIDHQKFPVHSALMMPKTDDGRVLFAVPWQGKVIIATTDTPVEEVTDEPVALDQEVDFLINHFNRYTESSISKEDVRSVFAGLRPLLKEKGKTGTAFVSRDHKVIVTNAGLVTITGGKWTTYRRMAKDAVDNAIFVGKLDRRNCISEQIRIHGWAMQNVDAGKKSGLFHYGSDAAFIESLFEKQPEWGNEIIEGAELTIAEVVWAVRNEMAMRIEDVLARRNRLLLKDAMLAMKAAPRVAEIMAIEMGKDETWIQEEMKSFMLIAKNYSLN